MPRHRSIRHPTAHEEKFQVPTLWLVFCHNQSCIFDAYESALTIEDLWLYLSMHEQPVPRHGKNSTQQKKERDRERERERERQRREKNEHRRMTARASINRPEDKGWWSARRIVSSQNRATRAFLRRGRRVELSGPYKRLLAISIARATRCHHRRPHVDFSRSLRATLRLRNGAPTAGYAKFRDTSRFIRA